MSLYMRRSIDAYAFNLNLHLKFEIDMHINFVFIHGGFEVSHFPWSVTLLVSRSRRARLEERSFRIKNRFYTLFIYRAG